MERIEPSSFYGPRAYFTTFDYRIIARTDDVDSLRLDVERQLKMLLLTKATVVCAASHLLSDVSFDILQRNPVLLEKSLVVPAMRRDKRDMKDVAEGRNFPDAQRREMEAYYRDHLNRVVNWDLQDNSRYLRNSLLHQLRDSKSVLSNRVTAKSRKHLQRLIVILSSSETIARGMIEEFSESLANEGHRRLLDLRELLYHISGARAINCKTPSRSRITWTMARMSAGKADKPFRCRYLLEVVS